jgi:dTDP-4-amino-4,6-dideoxygalactose transaminase
VIAVETQEQRDALIAHLEQQGVSVLIHYPIPTHAQIAFQRKSSAENTLDVTDSLSLRILSLPMNLVLEEKEQGHVIGVLKAFFEAFKQKSSQGETLQKTVICSQ